MPGIAPAGAPGFCVPIVLVTVGTVVVAVPLPVVVVVVVVAVPGVPVSGLEVLSASCEQPVNAMVRQAERATKVLVASGVSLSRLITARELHSFSSTCPGNLQP